MPAGKINIKFRFALQLILPAAALFGDLLGWNVDRNRAHNGL